LEPKLRPLLVLEFQQILTVSLPSQMTTNPDVLAGAGAGAKGAKFWLNVLTKIHNGRVTERSTPLRLTDLLADVLQAASPTPGRGQCGAATSDGCLVVAALASAQV
jgi:hypothetical protein